MGLADGRTRISAKPKMTGFLASVTGPKEAEAAITGGADIIDLKNPLTGALGALPFETVKASVETVNQRAITSATIGDLPPDPVRVTQAVRKMKPTGVEIIKIGFFQAADYRPLIDALTHEASEHQLVAVLFADQQPNLDLLPHIAACGFYGVMLDTATKDGGGLLANMDTKNLSKFIQNANQLGLISGLAGQLSADDIPALLPLKPDYLGFRTALCRNNNRKDELDTEVVRVIKKMITRDL